MLSMGFINAQESAANSFDLAVQKRDIATFKSTIGEMTSEQREAFMELYTQSVHDYAELNRKKDISKVSECEAIFEMRNAMLEYDERLAKPVSIYRWRLNLTALGRIVIKAIL